MDPATIGHIRLKSTQQSPLVTQTLSHQQVGLKAGPTKLPQRFSQELMPSTKSGGDGYYMSEQSSKVQPVALGVGELEGVVVGVPVDEGDRVGVGEEETQNC